MMHTVQLSIADAVYRDAVRDALSHSGPWRVEVLARPDLKQRCVIVIDEAAFESLPLPVTGPERVVLVTRRDPKLLANAWDAGIVSVVSAEDPMNTVLLAIMAAALRVGTAPAQAARGISPSGTEMTAPINSVSGDKRSKCP